MPGTKSIVLDKHTVLLICNALNLEASTFDTLSENSAFPPQSRELFAISARDRRSISRNLIDQWDKA